MQRTTNDADGRALRLLWSGPVPSHDRVLRRRESYEESLADYRRDGFFLLRSLLKLESRFIIAATLPFASLLAA
jgi:hypothetical protein